MKKVIVNGRFLLHRITGVERYAREILDELDKIIEPDLVEIAIPPEAKNVPDYKNIKAVKIGKLKDHMWEHISFPMYVRMQNAISMNLCNVAPLSDPGIVCIHDVKIKATPQFFNRIFLLWYSLLFLNETKRAKIIITVSEFSKEEIIKYYHISPDRIYVIPNSWQHYKRVDYDSNALDKYGLKKDGYYFSICSLEPNKNFKWIAEVAQKEPDSIFAIAGSLNKRVFADVLGFECLTNMKLLGYIRDEEAKTLMRDCKAFLFPTFYEGFGIPPLEAMSAGAKQIVVSDTAVMHEIFGDSVVYVDPQKPQFSLNKTSSQKCDDVLNKYSWAESGRKLKELINRVCGNEVKN